MNFINEINKIFVGKVFNIDNNYIYIKSNIINNSSIDEKNQMIMFNNEVLTYPKIGSFIKVVSFNINNIVKVIAEKIMNHSTGNFKVFKCEYYGIYNEFNGFTSGGSESISAGSSAYLFTNREISFFNMFQPKKGEFVDNVGIIKNTNAEFYLNTNFFTSDVLFIGDKFSGKTSTVSNIYNNLFDKFILNFSSNQKFIFFDYKNEFSKLFVSSSLKKNIEKIKKYNFKRKNRPINLISLKKILNVLNFDYDDLLILSCAKNNIQEKFIIQFYDELHFKRRINYLDDLFINSVMNSKSLSKTKDLFEYLISVYDVELFNEEKTIEKVNYIYKNIYYENGLFITKQFLRENKGKLKDLFDYSEIKKNSTELLFSITQEKFLVILDSFLKTRKKDILENFKIKLSKIIENDVKLLIKTKLISNLSENEDNYFQISEVTEKFTNSWNYVLDLFGSLNEMNEKENIIILNFSNLDKKTQEIFTLLYLKLILKDNKFFVNKNSYINLLIDDINNIFWDQNLNNHELKYKSETIELLLKRKNESLIFLFYITNLINNSNIELINMFDNIGIFSTKNDNLKKYLLNNFKYNKINNSDIENLNNGEVLFVGKNFNMPSIIKINKQPIFNDNSFTVELNRNIFKK